MPNPPTLSKTPLDNKLPLKKVERRALLWDILKKTCRSCCAEIFSTMADSLNFDKISQTLNS